MNHFSPVRINVIPHKAQSYDTCGNWYYVQGNPEAGDKLMKLFHGLRVDVSEMDDWRSEAAIAIHELVEACICRHQNVSAESVDAFDIEMETIRAPYVEANDTEFFFRSKALPIDFDPGDHPDAPYYFAHQTATIAERIFCFAVQLDWIEHNERLNALSR